MAEPLDDHYRTLGVSERASAEEVRAAYRRRSRELHPDRNASPDATRRMAALNAAYQVLREPGRRAAYDRERGRTTGRRAASYGGNGYGAAAGRPRRSEPKPFATPPVAGPGAPQPERMPDWYRFLGIDGTATGAQVIEAINRTGAAIRAAGYSPEDEDRLRIQLRRAAGTLTNPAVRAIYDDALDGVAPKAGTYPEFHRHWYSVLGVRPRAPLERIAEEVTALSARLPRTSREYREVEAAWRVLRDPEKRAAYDEEIGLTARV